MDEEPSGSARQFFRAKLTMVETLRSIEQGDLELIRGWRNHPDIRKLMFSSREVTPEEHLVWFQKASQDRSRSLLVYVENDTPLGFMQFSPTKEGSTIFEWGFYAAHEAPKGTGSKMAKLSLDFAFNQLNATKVFGEVLEHNTGSIRFHKKMGFLQEGCLRKHHFDGKEYFSVICFGLMKEEWINEQ